MTRNIIAVVDDLFFASKIRGTAEQAGVSVAFARSADGVSEIIQHDIPSLIICDLHAQRINPIELAKDLKAKPETKNIPLLGFFSHVQTQLQRDAQKAGFDRVIPRSVFTKDLVEILRSA
jgi:CheY-like chemotaxis protein